MIGTLIRCLACSAVVMKLPGCLMTAAALSSFICSATLVAQVAAGIELSEKIDAKEGSARQEAPPEQQSWSFHAQATEIFQGQPGFDSPYKGTNSLPPEDNFRQTSSFDIYLAAHLWPGGEIYINPEFYQGFGLGRTRGIAAFPNAEAYKVGQKIGDVFFPHLFYRQTFGLGGEQEQRAGDLLQLAQKQDISRLTFTAGRLAVGDQLSRRYRFQYGFAVSAFDRPPTSGSGARNFVRYFHFCEN